MCFLWSKLCYCRDLCKIPPSEDWQGGQRKRLSLLFIFLLFLLLYFLVELFKLCFWANFAFLGKNMLFVECNNTPSGYLYIVFVLWIQNISLERNEERTCVLKSVADKCRGSLMCVFQTKSQETRWKQKKTNHTNKTPPTHHKQTKRLVLSSQIVSLFLLVS